MSSDVTSRFVKNYIYIKNDHWLRQFLLVLIWTTVHILRLHFDLMVLLSLPGKLEMLDSVILLLVFFFVSSIYFYQMFPFQTCDSVFCHHLR